MTILEQAKSIREAMDIEAETLDYNKAVECIRLFPQWSELVKKGENVKKGFRFQHEGKLYRTEQAEYTFVAYYVPGTAGTESLFSKVDEAHKGTIEDPIPYEKNMEIYDGMYYTQNGVLYLCIRSSGQPMYHDLESLIGIYVEVVV